MLSESTFIKQKEKLEETNQKRNLLAGQLSRKTEFYYCDVEAPKNKAKKFFERTVATKELEKQRIETLNEKKKYLQASQDMSKRDNPPVSSQDKEKVSRERYAARRKIVFEHSFQKNRSK